MAHLEIVRLPVQRERNTDPTEADMERAFSSDLWSTEKWVKFCESEYGPLTVEEWDGGELQAGGYMCVGGVTYVIPIGHPYKLVKVTPEHHTCPNCGAPI